MTPALKPEESNMLNLTTDNPADWYKFDIRTRRGQRVIIIAVLAGPKHLVGGRTVVAMYETSTPNEYALNSWFANGRFYPRDRLDELDLIIARSDDEGTK